MTLIISGSREEAERLGSDIVSPVHLLLAVMRQNGSNAARLINEMLPDAEELYKQLENSGAGHVIGVTTKPGEVTMDAMATRIMRLSMLEARMMKAPVVDSEHLLLAMLKERNNSAGRMLESQGISSTKLKNLMNPGSIRDEIQKNEDEEEDEFSSVGSGAASTAEEGMAAPQKSNSPTPILDNFSTDLTKAARSGKLDPVVGREKEIERVTQILCRRKKNNPILIGEPGVGKSAIVEGLAARIAERNVPRLLWNQRILMLDMASMVAGTKYRGQFEERIKGVIGELKKNPNIIVFIDEIHTMIGAGGASGSMDAANLLKPALARGEFKCIGATTVDEFRKTIEKDGALDRRFQKVMVRQTTAIETLQILEQLRPRYEEHHHVTFTDEALKACVKLTEQYVSSRAFPDKALDALDEAGARVHLHDIPTPSEIEKLEGEVEEMERKRDEAAQAQNFELAADYRDHIAESQKVIEEKRREWEQQIDQNRPTVTAETIADVVSVMTGIPAQRLGQEEKQRLMHLDESLKLGVIGQDDAIRRVVRAIQRSRIGLKDPKKPIGTFLFVGPTGVGKTYLTKQLALEMFGSEDALIRIDMSEYMEKHTVSRMVGAPPGYVGYEEGGQLTEQVRRKPYSIVLLDEIEKAHQDVFNMLLQVMDEGRLTDGNGATIDFKNTIIIMTSNCGTRQLKDFGSGIGYQKPGERSGDNSYARSIVDKALKKQFAPEFLNRLDDVIHFDQLSEESIGRIVNLQLKPLLRRIETLGYKLDVTDEARSLIAKKGYDVQYGARPLARAIQSLIEDPLCEVLMKGGRKKHFTTVVEDDSIAVK